ncbi:MAG: DUF4097 family beta strand repeat-containing protein [candidate division WOR-3 bacterium]
MGDERARILKLLEDGKITVDQAARLIEALGSQRHGPELEIPVGPPRVRRRLAMRELERIPDLVAHAVSKAVQSSLEVGDERRVQFSGKRVLAVRNVSGDVAVEGQTGNATSLSYTGGMAKVREGDDSVDFRSVSSDVDARVPVKSDCEVTTVSGDVEIARIDGRVWVKSVSGDVEIAEHAGQTEVVTVSGDVGLARVQGELMVETRSGDVVVEAAGRVQGLVATRSGDITLVLGSDEDAVLEAQADDDGAVVLDLAVPHEVLEQRDNYAKVKFGAGSASITLRTRTGEITIRNAKED